MLNRSDYLQDDYASEEDDINIFEYISLNEDITDYSETASADTATLIAEKLDTIIEYESNIHYAVWTLIGVVSFIVVVRLLWTVFDKWFFGGV